jgi:hypothetical protein
MQVLSYELLPAVRPIRINRSPSNQQPNHEDINHPNPGSTRCHQHTSSVHAWPAPSSRYVGQNFVAQPTSIQEKDNLTKRQQNVNATINVTRHGCFASYRCSYRWSWSPGSLFKQCDRCKQVHGRHHIIIPENPISIPKNINRSGVDGLIEYKAWNDPDRFELVSVCPSPSRFGHGRRPQQKFKRYDEQSGIRTHADCSTSR